MRQYGRAIELKLIGLPQQSALLFLGAGILENPYPTPWGTWHLLPPWTSFDLGLMPGTGFLEIPATIPTGSPVPYDLPMQGLVKQLTNLKILEIR